MEIFPITIDVITAINKISPESIWTDVPQKELNSIFVIKLDISNVPVGGSMEISEDGELWELYVRMLTLITWKIRQMKKRHNMPVPLDGLISIQWCIRGTRAAQTGIIW